MCVVPNGDLFKALRHARPSMPTDQTETFTADAIQLTSGGKLEPDLSVPATGLDVPMCRGVWAKFDG